MSCHLRLILQAAIVGHLEELCAALVQHRAHMAEFAASQAAWQVRGTPSIVC